MYGYATASSVATELTPFDLPRQTTSPGGLSAQSTALTQAAGTPAGTQQGTLSQMIGGWNPFAPGSASDTTGLNGVLNAIFGTNTAFGQFANNNILNTIFMSAFFMPAKHPAAQSNSSA
jgi:PPE-repeat protein